MVDKAIEPLILDLLEWVAKGDRGYEEVMEVWRTSCPRLPVWEDANDRGLVMMDETNERCIVRITPLGRALLRQGRRLQRTEHDGSGLQ
jgi:D-3-phosphoglycerate dehydrogenase